MRKRILIVIHYMELGGAEMSLLGLLHALDFSRVDVDLFVHSHRGELMRFIPKEVNLLPEIPEYAQIERPMKDALRDGYWRIVLRRLWAKHLAKRFDKRHDLKGSGVVFQYVADSVLPCLPPINPGVCYDLAISFLIQHNIVLKKVNARRKVCWIHTDYRSMPVDVGRELPVWGAYERIVSISPNVSESFLSVFPSLSGKVILIPNILPVGFVRERSEAFDPASEFGQKDGAVILLSVGRFSYAKNYDNVPDICRRIVSRGVNVRWYLIGYGGDESLIRSKIARCGMEDRVIILGKRDNPYPYMKACDVYVQPSRYEGNSITVREAQVLCRPVVVSAYPTAGSQVRDGMDGVIVPQDNEGCANGITNFIKDEDRRRRVVEYLRGHDFGGTDEVRKIYDLL